ncbi:DUF11 domain-containing protein [Microbispora sitophila]|uniref:DUF11 domain-containing protein n=1 Tax=Microbispora sitophila TaxID=2771537 RepID=UPI001D00CA7B
MSSSAQRRVIVTKSASPQGPVNAGDVITYRVTAVNQGGGAADNVRLSDTVPAGTTFVPGSLKIVDGPGAGAKTDPAGDDQGAFDAATGKVTFTLVPARPPSAGARCLTATPRPAAPPWSSRSKSAAPPPASRSSTRPASHMKTGSATSLNR